ncbi:hypothetical protein HBI25_004670 [Parastagonospora nodorum]|nr:hypothetical protein HBH74_082960 [Parastagonospora nodorum]KAH4997076.1 hypothetical protein HBH73_008180 [Parastagonospora nodorum]KAH5043141.1 hypothetical protein HBI74_012410 [Parastagonospora nodorum]KAH5086181.1 hypothetical protein HBH95_013230 [Parastagonospora nodorum]KAH5103749.1 hypothetical protein HBH72_074710 [Parastagonospora nodorum]
MRSSHVQFPCIWICYSSQGLRLKVPLSAPSPRPKRHPNPTCCMSCTSNKRHQYRPGATRTAQTISSDRLDEANTQDLATWTCLGIRHCFEIQVRRKRGWMRRTYPLQSPSSSFPSPHFLVRFLPCSLSSYHFDSFGLVHFLEYLIL